MRICLKGPQVIESETINDINHILTTENARLTTLDPEWDPAQEDVIPYPFAKEQKVNTALLIIDLKITEFKSFFDTPAARESIEKKSKNMLSRIQMLNTIRTKILPTPEITIPLIPGNYPAFWWRENEDRDLLLGTLIYGYGKYEDIRVDQSLCYYKKYVDLEGNFKLHPEIDIPEGTLTASASLNDLNIADLIKTESPDAKISEIVVLPAGLEAMEVDFVPEATPAISIEKEKESEQINIDEPVTIVMDIDTNINSVNDGSETILQEIVPPLEVATEKSTKPEHELWYVWPSPSELGIRLRKIIAAFNRLGHSTIRDQVRTQASLDKQKEKTQKELDRLKMKEHELSRKDKIEFIRVVMSFGIEYDPENLSNRIWGRFKELSNLKKSDETLNEHYEKMFALANEVIVKGDLLIKEYKDQDARILKGIEGTPVVFPIAPLKSENDHSTEVPKVEELPSEAVAESSEPRITKFNPNLFKIDNDGDILAYEKAKRMIKRLEVMKTLREVVLPHPELDERLLAIRSSQRTVLPA